MCPCVAPCLCSSCTSSGPIPWLECLHVSVHVCMCTWLPTSAACPLHTWMEICVVAWCHVCSSCTSSGLTHCLECVYASVHIWISLISHVCSTPYHSCVQMCGPVCMSQSPLLWSQTLVRMYACISMSMHAHLTPHVCSTPFAELHTSMYTIWCENIDFIYVLVIWKLAINLYAVMEHFGQNLFVANIWSYFKVYCESLIPKLCVQGAGSITPEARKPLLRVSMAVLACKSKEWPTQ